MTKKFVPILLIVLLAFVLRAYALTDIPPGLTHDEANHGREALDILDGVLLFYFPLNYGSEPLYSYTVAGTMLLFGKSLFSLRLVNVVFGVAAIGATYLWAVRAFDRRMGLLTAVLFTLSFWPLASSRQALRAGMLPFFMVGAVWYFWQLIEKQNKLEKQKIKWGVVIGFGVCVAITLHIYLAARVVWLLFPLFLIYLSIVHRDKLRQAWLPTLIGLLLAGVLVMPMFIYLQRYPYALTRLDMLDGPLQQLTSGNFKPIFNNMSGALLAFVWPGYGDKFLAYNIPGRPVFDGITAVFFIIGLFVAAWRWKRPSYAMLLLWFFVGIAPSLITGATANTTRNLAALPVVHMIPVVGFLTVITRLQKRLNKPDQRMWMGAAALWLTIAAGITLNDYFVQWTTRPDVRDAYQHTLFAEVDYLQTNQTTGPLIMSSVYPGPAHDPS
ncbi:MAG: phospholipid carrier-dependent glycosyltransferase, partial [Chloroflexi bacterium]